MCLSYMCSYNPLTSLTGAGMLWMEVQLDDAENMAWQKLAYSPSVFLQNESSGFSSSSVYHVDVCQNTQVMWWAWPFKAQSSSSTAVTHVKLNEHHCHFNHSNELLHWQTIEVNINSYWRFFVIFAFSLFIFLMILVNLLCGFVVLLDIVHAFLY